LVCVLPSFPINAAATLACIYEATARKPGNVYPGADFDETTTYASFVKSAIAIGPFIEKAPSLGVGITVLDAVRATRDVVGSNTNLGTLLLIAPLAAVPADVRLEDGIGHVLAALTPDDTHHVYEAIRISQAGGLGRSATADVSSDPPPNLSLTEAMRLAADRDLVAKQYVNKFDDVFVGAAGAIEFGLALNCGLESAILQAFLIQLAHFPDSLIQRKCGPAIAEEARVRAEGVLMSGGESDGLGSEKFQRALDDFDCWLRADGHRRNPGTTADLIAAGLFVLLREGRLNWKVW
jgi:triphosphoribosyl-dephospho-CoA synthase